MNQICIEHKEISCKSYPRCYGCNSFQNPTVFDHIQSMTVEELAEQIIDLIENRPFTDYDKCATCIETHCTKCVIEWLKNKVD